MKTQPLGPDINGFVANVQNSGALFDSRVRQAYIDQRIGLTAMMGTNKLARQVGMEWWKVDVYGFRWEGYTEDMLRKAFQSLRGRPSWYGTSRDL